jgi:hypothetical protein
LHGFQNTELQHFFNIINRLMLVMETQVCLVIGRKCIFKYYFDEHHFSKNALLYILRVILKVYDQNKLCGLQGGLISLWLYKENNNLRD